VKIVEDSTVLSLLQQTTNVLQKRVEKRVSIENTRDSKLNFILQQMQISIVKLETKSSYAKTTRKKIEQISSTIKKLTKNTTSSFNENRQIEKFIVNVTNEMKKNIMKAMFTKDIMIKLQKKTKKIREMIRLINEFIEIQATSKETRIRLAMVRFRTEPTGSV
jgi:hypothetical protein